jgi:hypothetical protein
MSPIDKVSKEPCTCVKCTACGGSGYYYVDMGGRYVGAHRFDDLHDTEYCEFCLEGISEVCARCQLLDDMDDDAQEA